MRVQDYAAEMTEWAVGNFYRNVERVQADKLDWKVLDKGRSVLDQVQEVARSPLWTVPMLRDKSAQPYDPERIARMKEEMAQWTSIDRCKEMHYANLGPLLEAIRGLSDEDLLTSIEVPFASEPVALGSIIMFHYWNVVYHLGQILFIQTLYDDHEMAF